MRIGVPPWNEAVWRAIDGLMHRSKRQHQQQLKQQNDNQKQQQEPDSKVDWPHDRLQSLDFCRMGGLAGSEKKAVAT